MTCSARSAACFHGTVVDVKLGRGFLVADAYWVPPEGDPIGPMALEIECADDPAGCRLKVRQSGFEPAPRWRRYYRVVSRAGSSHSPHSSVTPKRYPRSRNGRDATRNARCSRKRIYLGAPWRAMELGHA
jgi:hypothetical protein